MEKKFLDFKCVVNFQLKHNQSIDLTKLAGLCKDLEAKYEPEFGFRSVNIKQPPYYLCIFSTGKAKILGTKKLNEKELDLILMELFNKKIKKCLIKQ